MRRIVKRRARLCVRCIEAYAERGSKLCRMCQFEHDRQVAR